MTFNERLKRALVFLPNTGDLHVTAHEMRLILDALKEPEPDICDEEPAGFVRVKQSKETWNAQLRKAMKHLPQNGAAPVTSDQIGHMMTNLKAPEVPWYITDKEPEPCIITNICDECQRPFYRDPTPEEVEKYKEPEPEGDPYMDGMDEELKKKPPVRHPDGRIWHVCDNPCDGIPHALLNASKTGYGVRPMTSAEAWKVGAVVRWECDSDIVQGKIIAKGVGLVTISIIGFGKICCPVDELSLVKPAQETSDE